MCTFVRSNPIIFLIAVMLFAACSSTSNESTTETSTKPLLDTIATESNTRTTSEPPKLRWSEFLGHFFKYIPYDTFKYELPEVSKTYYDIRFGDNSLIVVKCQDFGDCGDKFSLTFSRISKDSIIFQPLKTNGTQARQFSFYQNSVFVNEPNDSTRNWETVRYDAYPPIDEED